jgi:tellurite resistance protein
MRFGAIVASLFLGLTLSSGALAAPIAPPTDAKAHAGKAHERQHAQYPMPAAAFKQHVDAKIARKRSHMESRASKMTAERAKELRARFDAGVARVRQEVAVATADGTVTADEAKKVRHAMHAAFHHRRGKK